MKTSFKVIIAILAAGLLGAIATRPAVTHAQQVLPSAQTPAPVTITPTPMQYKVIDIGTIPVAKGHTAVGTLEAILNEMGARGWRVVSTSGSFVILMQ